MPRLKSSMKDLKKSRKNREHNLVLKKAFKREHKKIEQLMAAGDVKKLKAEMNSYVSKVDKAVVKKIIQKNTASRIKARFLKKIHTLSKAGTAKKSE